MGYLFAPFAVLQVLPALALVPAALLGWLQYRAAWSLLALWRQRR